MGEIDRETALSRAVLHAIEVRSKAALHNIVNQDVPGYKRYQVRFEELLRSAVATGKSPAEVEPLVERDTSGAPGSNNVSLVSEMGTLDKMHMLHEVFSRRAGAYFSTLNRAIFGR
ncbi:MAG TPA: hypothetical protein VK348_09735 [Planctomycetota bacterium]|nr:hypothetical protein [Planctomycetota bacterium]